MHKILFLDDNERRLEEAVEHYVHNYDGDADIFTVRTVPETLAHLQPGTQWDIVSLNHDLGGRSFDRSGRRPRRVAPSSRADCGMEVVRVLTSLKPRPIIGLIIIHSWNRPAARRMAQMLRSVNFTVQVIPWKFEGAVVVGR